MERVRGGHFEPFKPTVSISHVAKTMNVNKVHLLKALEVSGITSVFRYEQPRSGAVVTLVNYINPMYGEMVPYIDYNNKAHRVAEVYADKVDEIVNDRDIKLLIEYIKDGVDLKYLNRS